MKRFTHKQESEIAAAMSAATVAQSKLEDAIKDFNSKIDAAGYEVEDLMNAYNDKIEDLKSIYRDIASDARSYYDERSDNWKEGEVGEAYSNWCDTLESVENELDPVELELPEQIDMPDFAILDDGLTPTEPE